tara:strand:+ start:63 stop:464 length:402 start_codon:yes stop_codon:yes gene_type:complete
MKKELQNKLFEKYPKIFRQKDLSPQETAMCRGITCGDGWYTLIDTMCGNIQNHVEYVNRSKPEEEYIVCEATQVKEKWGGLRFYVQGSDDFIDGVIKLAESMSCRICTECGNQSILQKKRGWVYTLCDNCQNV